MSALDENVVTITCTVHAQVSRDWQDKKYWSLIVKIAGEREFDGLVEEIEDFVKVKLPRSYEKKLGEMAPGTRLRIEGRISGKLNGTGDGCFAEIAPRRFTMLAPPPVEGLAFQTPPESNPTLPF